MVRHFNCLIISTDAPLLFSMSGDITSAHAYYAHCSACGAYICAQCMEMPVIALCIYAFVLYVMMLRVMLMLPGAPAPALSLEAARQELRLIALYCLRRAKRRSAASFCLWLLFTLLRFRAMSLLRHDSAAFCAVVHTSVIAPPMISLFVTCRCLFSPKRACMRSYFRHAIYAMIWRYEHSSLWQRALCHSICKVRCLLDYLSSCSSSPSWLKRR